MSNISLTYPYLLFVMIPLIIAVVVGFLLLPKAKRKRRKNIISLCLHVVICVTLSLAFADIRYLKNTSDVEMYLVVDCSASEEQSVDKIDEIIKGIYDKADTSSTKIGVVCFGENAEVLVKAGGRFSSVSDIYDEKKHPDFSKNASDIKSALLYTNELYSDDVVRRMVLISDGQETDNEAVSAMSTLNSENVYLDCVSINEKEGDEIAITGLNYTDHCYVNKTQSLTVAVRSRKESTINLDLTSSGSVVEEKEVTLVPGMNLVNFSLPSNKVGSFDYQVSIKGGVDTFDENNTMSFTQDFTDKFNVLFIGGSPSSAKKFEGLNLYTDNTTIKVYNDPDDAPYTIEEFVKYDEIVLSDVNVQNMEYGEEFVDNLETAVSVYGKTLSTYGATFSTGSSLSYVDTYNDMLPVQNQSDEGRAVVFLIDVSSSMDSDSRLTKAKTGVIKALDALGENDYVGVVTFSDTTKVVQSLTSVRNKATIAAKVKRINSESTTTMLPGLKEAYKQLKSSKADSRTVITLSDGYPFDSDSDLTNYVRRCALNNIVFSFINISNNQSSAIQLLKNMARYGNGNYYYVRSASELVNIMINSVAEDLAEQLVEEETPVYVRLPEDPSLSGVTTDFPDIETYNFCRLKSGSNTVLSLQYEKSNSGETDDSGNEIVQTVTVPLYAYWSYGKGKVTSFTSSLEDDACSSFMSDDNGLKFLRQASANAMPDRNLETILDISYENHGKTSTVYVGTNTNANDAKVSIVVTSPNSDVEEKSYDLYYNGSSYTNEIETGDIGKYNLHVVYSLKDGNDYKVDQEVDEPLYFDYSQEYDVFSYEENDLLYELAESSNGKYSIGEYNYEILENEIANSSYKSTMMFFILLSVLLFLVDVFIRKSDFKFKNKKVATAA